MLSPKIIGLDPRQTQHFRNLIEGQGLVAVTFQSESLESAAGDIAARGG